MTVSKALFTAGLRTPFARAHKGAYMNVRPDDLLVGLFREQAKRNSSLAGPEDVIAGCAYPEGEQGYNVARMAALGAGLEAPGMTINRLCGSALEAAAVAAARINAGWGARYLVGGIESMTRIPRKGAGFSESELVKQTVPQAYISMGETAEEVARRYPRVTRDRQEEFSARSHELAHKAFEDGHYASTVVPTAGLSRDEGIRYPADRAKMAQLKPAFLETGVVTAATSSPLSDGATSGWVLREDEARKSGVRDGLRILDVAWSHVAPEIMGMGPGPAMKSLFQRRGIKPSAIAAYEINEAFAVQVLAVGDDLELPLERINTWGGAIAVGHPLGASGLRLLMTLHARLAHEDRAGALGVASLCIGGGQGLAVLTEYVKL
jgi:acetyl-CoA acyltransferase